MKRFIKKDSTDQTIDVFIQDSTSSTGAGLTGLAYNTASLVCYYRRGATGSATALSLATQSVGGAHSDGGFVEISSSNMPGMYRLDLSDAIVATGVPYVTIYLKGAANMAPVTIEIQLEAAPSDVTHWLGTAPSSPNTAGVPKVDAVLWLGGAIPSPNTTGVPKVDPILWLGSAIATPTVAGVPEVDVTYVAGSLASASTGTVDANIVQISGNATAADNCQLMFDGTGYAGGTIKLETDLVSIGGDSGAADNFGAAFGSTAIISVNAVQISGDTTAADNCESMFDGTGYAGGTIKLGVDAVAISGSTTAADGVEIVHDTHRNFVTGTVGATVSSSSVFDVTVAADTAANSHKYMMLTLIRASNGVRERQRINSHTRVDATTIRVTLATAFASSPTTGDKVLLA